MNTVAKRRREENRTTDVRALLRSLMGVCAGLFLVCCLIASQAFADGVIIPNPTVPLAIKEHIVTVNIDNQVANTHVDQTFLNETKIGNIEGTYIFPLPEGAIVTDFAMDVDGEMLQGVLMSADSARMIYEEIVRRLIDPALLEYAGRGAYKARIFPINAESEKRVQLDYTELLTIEDGVCRYVYPLNTEKFSSKPLEYVSVEVTLSSNVPIKNVYSALHDISVERLDDYNVKVHYADEETVPNQDFILYYTVSTDDIGMNLLTYNDGTEYGFYLLMLAPKVALDESEIAAKRMIFVLDTSGSMQGREIEQAKEALIFCLNALNPKDEFNIVNYSSEVEQLSEVSWEAIPENISAATEYVNALYAGGGTNSNSALLTALELMVDDGLVNTIIFLTDGKPTGDVSDPDVICDNVRNVNQTGTRIFCFGVGDEVNTHFLDNLSGGNHGFSSYVKENETIDEVVASFFRKVSNPVLADVHIDFGESIIIRDDYPHQLPDLFQGTQLLQLGRFRGEGSTTITLEGQIGGQPKTYPYPAVFDREDKQHDFIPRLWATRRIGHLLDQIRLHGEDEGLVEELKDEIVYLATRYGIVTEYTSFLIQEEVPGDPLTLDEGFWFDTGADAVRAAENVKSWGGAGTTQNVRAMEIKYVGDKTFYERGDFWQDSQYNEGDGTVDYVFGTTDYFALIAAKPYLGKYMGLGKNVIVQADGVNYRIMEDSTGIEEGSTKSELPSPFRLEQNVPNPFNPGTTIRFTMQRSGSVQLCVHNLAGQRIRTLLSGEMLSGEYTAAWDGKDEQGRAVSSGLYLYRVTVNEGEYTTAKKMVLIR